MKTLIVSLFIIASSVSAFAAEDQVTCWGRDEQGQTISVDFDRVFDNVITLSVEVPDGEMPPYPKKPLNSWSIVTLDYSDASISATGVTTLATTGQHGRFSLQAKATGTSNTFGKPRTYYVGEVSTLPATNRLLPRVATVYPVTCMVVLATQPVPN